MKYQGYDITSNIFYQENQSAMHLEKNGRKYCGKKSCHIDIHYFLNRDVLIHENIKLKYPPTEQMVPDFYTKLFQGSLFKKMRYFIMGISNSLFEERVENMANSENEIHSRLNTQDSISAESQQTIKNKKQYISYADVVNRDVE